ncbi:ferredoxin [Candidatus Woesearchaeota archaeon]|nr:ferredoxin [Candidatus Woesearchaeota archaeon]
MPSISVDKEKCIGCGACAAVCSEAFKMQKNKAVAVKPEVEELSCEKQGADVCPVQAITIK